MFNNIIIAMWSGPRNLSTALMRSFGNRSDVANVLEIEDKQRVDAINNFDFARDYDTRVNGSKFLTLQNRTLTDFTRCKTNRVLLHDDISDRFSSEGFESTNTIIEPLLEDIAHYLVQIVDPDTLDTQFTELVLSLIHI